MSIIKSFFTLLDPFQFISFQISGLSLYLKAKKSKYILSINPYEQKNVGFIKSASQKNVGQIYRPSASQQRLSTGSTAKNSLRGSRKSINQSANRKRSSSAGKIYRVCSADKKQYIYSQEDGHKDYRNLIDYEEMQHKLSNYLACTIRTNSRQKYNYLSQHYAPLEVQPYSYNKLAICARNLEPKRSILGLTENRNHENVYTWSERAQANTMGSEKKEKKTLLKESLYKRKQRSQSRTKNKENIQVYKESNQFSLSKQTKASFYVKSGKESKSGLSNKLMEIIDNYETKNKELSFEMRQLEARFQTKKTVTIESSDTTPNESKDKINQYNNEKESSAESSLSLGFDQLLKNNLKTICLNSSCDERLDQLWKAIHSQILYDQKLRLIKAFVKDTQENDLLALINSKRIKKIEMRHLRIHTEEYDPFLVEKIEELLKSAQQNPKDILTWIAKTYIKCQEQAERHWLKYLSQQKIQCSIRAIILEKEVIGLRQNDTINKDLNLRDLTRWLSIIYKATLRNRNLYQIFSKLKDMPYIGRFIQILEQKAGKGSDTRKFASSK